MNAASDEPAARGWRAVAQATFSLLAVSIVASTALFSIDRVRAFVLPNVRGWLPAPAMLTAWAGHVLLALTVALAGGIAWRVGRLAGRSGGPRSRIAEVAASAVTMVLLAAWPLLWVGGQLVAGEWISKQWFAPAVRFGLLGAWVCAAPVVAALIRTATPGDRLGPRVRIVAFAIGIVGATLIDHLVARGLFPAFHLLAHVAVVISALLLVREVFAVLRPRWSAARRHGVRVRAAIVIAALGTVVSWTTMSQATRSALVLNSPVLQHWLREVLPTPPSTLLRDVLTDLDVTAGAMVADAAVAEQGLIVGGERWNVLLVVVDTLRADALPPWRPENGTAFAEPGDTPNLDAWLEGTYRFTRAHAAATMTHKSMPSMLRSIEVGEDPIKTGLPIARRMAALGRTPVAVINEYFYGSKQRAVYPLLEGFEDIRVYEKRDGQDTVPHALELLDAVGHQPWFMWVHFYGMHEPGFDEKLLDASHGPRIDRYTMSLRWLDRQFATLLASLEARGLADRTVIVLAADHGEGLGDHDQLLHGPNVYEEDIAVPLAFWIPGRDGALIDASVGNIDIVPTLIDLLGGPPADARGRSLVPLMAGRLEAEPRTYYFENSNGRRFGVVSGADKLLYDLDAGSLHRYDLAEDPDESLDRFDPEGALDQALVRELLRFNPSVVASELGSRKVAELLGQRLDEVDPAAPGAAVPMLVRLVAAIPQPALIKRVKKIFKETTSVPLRLLIVSTLWKKSAKSLGEMVRQWLSDVEGTPSEGEIVAALALRGQAAFGTKAVAKRMTTLATAGTFASWEPWLRLIHPWAKKHDEVFDTPLDKMLVRAVAARNEAPPAVLEVLLDNVAGLGARGRKHTTIVRGLVEHREAGVRAASIRCLGKLDDASSTTIILAHLRDIDEDPRVRRDAIEALAAVAGADAVKPLTEVGSERGMTGVVIRALAKLGDEAAIPWLENVAKKDYNRWIRRAAKEALRKLGVETAKKREEDAETPPEDE